MSFSRRSNVPITGGLNRLVEFADPAAFLPFGRKLLASHSSSPLSGKEEIQAKGVALCEGDPKGRAGANLRERSSGSCGPSIRLRVQLRSFLQNVLGSVV